MALTIEQHKFRVALLSVISNSFLVIVKLLAGLAMGSISVISEAIHSGVDIFAAVVAAAGVRGSGQPADKQHSYGHGKFENLSGFIQALLILAAAVWIIWEAMLKLMRPEPMHTPGMGAVIMLVSALVNAVVARMLFAVAGKTDSVALKADAWHCLTDVYTSAGVMAGLVATWAGAHWLPHVNLLWIDPVAAMLVAALILKAAWDLTLESVKDLLDVSLPAVEEEAIKKIVRSHYPGVAGFHNFRTRKSGHVRFAEFHLLVDPGMSVGESHHLHHTIAQEIKTRFPHTEISVHIEPCDKTCTPRCKENCLKPEDGAPAIHRKAAALTTSETA
jgi:cation diffusion facilitator family transporter